MDEAVAVVQEVEFPGAGAGVSLAGMLTWPREATSLVPGVVLVGGARAMCTKNSKTRSLSWRAKSWSGVPTKRSWENLARTWWFRSVPNTLSAVTSPGPAKLLLVHEDDSFLQLVEAAGSPARELKLPPAGEFDVDLETLIQLNADHDSRIVGPSLEEDDTRAFVGTSARGVELGPVNHISISVTDVRHSAQWYAKSFLLMTASEEIADDGTGHVLLVSPIGGVRDPDGLQFELFAPAPM
jgi:hypothetical protein